MLKFNLKTPKPEEGFTILEVLVTALVIVGFLLGSLQAITLATIFRVQAQRKTEAVNSINNEKTAIEYEAFKVGDGFTPPSSDPKCKLIAFQKNLSDKTVTPPTGNYLGDIVASPSAATVAVAQKPSAMFDFEPNTQNIKLFNRPYYRLGRIYTFIPNATNPTTLQITWHLWDEGQINNPTNNPMLDGTGGDSDDRSISIITTEVVPNVGNCK